ncbi:unnamed protein product, partial [Symbiodinium microadriaticum]
MRVAPLGAWFADDVEQTIHQATLSAEVTHTHHEGIVGAVAIALAAGWAARREAEPAEDLIRWVASKTEESEVRKRLEWVSSYPLDTWPFTISSQVGSGLKISAQDTVPYTVWMAAAFLDDYEKALWTAARVGGDIDTTCAIIGGIVALNVGTPALPETWLRTLAMGTSFGNFTKYPRTPHLFGSKGTDDDKHCSEADSNAFIADDSLIVEEKLDGTNVGIHFSDEGELVLQCRGHLITEGMHPQYDLFKQWAVVKRQALEERLASRFILFGEWVYAQHSVHYRQLSHYFFEFDIYDKQTEQFLNLTARMQLLCGSGIQT